MFGDFMNLSYFNRKVQFHRKKVGEDALKTVKYNCNLSFIFIPVYYDKRFRRRYFTAVIKRTNKLICFKSTSVSVNPNDQIKLFDRQSNR